MRRSVFVLAACALVAAGSAQRILTGTGNGGPNIFRSNDQKGSCVLALIPFAGSGGIRVAAGNNLGGMDHMTDFIVGQGVGGTGRVLVYNGSTNALVHNFFAFPGFSGGVHVAGGDVNGDGVTDILVAGEGTDSPVKVFNGTDLSVLHSFFALPGFSGGVRVAAGDVNNDGFDDVIIANGPGITPNVNVYNGQTGAGIHSFFAYPTNFLGGVTVASGDVNGDGFDDIVTGAGPGAGPHVKVFSGTNAAVIRSFFAFDAGFQGGVTVGAGDLTGDGRAEVVAGQQSEGGEVKIFDGVTNVVSMAWRPEGSSFTGGLWTYVGALPTSPEFGFSLNKTTVAGQNSVAGTITTNMPVVNNTVFTTYDNSSLVNTPPTVTVLAGQSHRVFQITTVAINSSILTTLYAKLGTLTKSRPLTLAPLIPTSISFNPVQVVGGNPSQGRIVVNGVAGPGGRTISVVENSPYVDCPKTVIVPPGASDVFFNITTIPVPRQQNVLFRAIVSAGQTSATLRVTQ